MGEDTPANPTPPKRSPADYLQAVLIVRIYKRFPLGLIHTDGSVTGFGKLL